MPTATQRSPRPSLLLPCFIAAVVLAALAITDLVLVAVREDDVVWIVATAVAVAGSLVLTAVLGRMLRERAW